VSYFFHSSRSYLEFSVKPYYRAALSIIQTFLNIYLHPYIHPSFKPDNN